MASHFRERDWNSFPIARNPSLIPYLLNLALTRTPGDKLGPYVAPVGKGGLGARDTPP